MTKFISLLSAKGGTGKTTSVLNLGAALNYFGKNVTLVDGNISTPHIGLHLGFSNPKINLSTVLQGKHSILDSVYLHPSGLRIIPASLSLDDVKDAKANKLKSSLLQLTGTTDFVLIDSSAGLKELEHVINASDECFIVTNPDLLSVTDALKTIKLVKRANKEILGVILTRTGKKNDLTVKNIETMLDHKVVSIIPEDDSIRNSLIKRDIAILTNPRSKSSAAYKRLASLILNQDYEEPSERKKGLFSKLFKKKARD